MPSAVIGALRVDLNLGTAGWKKGLAEAKNDAKSAANDFKAVGGTITGIGAGLTAGITAPLIGIGVAAIKTAANFESSMIKLKIATQATGAEMKTMNDLALQLGKSTVFSASEAAGAMEELAKNGVSVQNILGGAAKAAVDLAAATGSELAPAAVAVSDAMNQFHLSAKDMPMLVNQITGAVNESKLDFADFQLGMAQAGGVAGAVGVSFQDFNAVLAGTSSMFSSGSDAGTSFKTFLTTFIPKSKQAAAIQEKYNLQFFDGAGKMRSMSAIADMLQKSLGGLNDKTKNQVLATYFGTDAMRTAVGLMQLGSKGLDDIAAKIGKTDAAAQSAERMKGLNAQLEQLGGTLETLAIQIGQTGLLDSVTGVVKGITDMLDKLTEFSPAAAQMVVAGAMIAAAIGPIMLVVGPLVSGVGSLIGLWPALVAGASALAPLLLPLAPIIVGIGAAVAAAYVAWQNWGTIGPLLGDWAAGVAQRCGEAIKWINSIFDWINKVNQSEGITGPFVQKTAVENAKSQFADMGKSSDDFLARLKTETSSTWDAIDKKFRDTQKWADDFDASAVRMWKSFVDMHARVQKEFTAMVDGISATVRGKFGESMDWVSDKAKKVGDAFFTLYDRVVGHSYVPDLVDGIALHMARLDNVMVKPVDAATGKAKDAFKQLRDDLAPILNELFPESRQLVELQNKLAVIARAEKAGSKNGGLDKGQADEARSRLYLGTDYATRDDAGMADKLDQWGKFDLAPMQEAMDALKITMPDLSKVAQDTTSKTVEAFAGMARDVVGSLRGMVSAFKGGDILGGLSGLLDIVSQVSGLIGGNKTARQAVTVTGGFGTPGYGGARALGGPVVPGKRYKVGERGPEWLEVNQPGRVIPDAGGSGRGGTNIYFSGVMTSDEFWSKIAAGNDGAAIRGATGGAQLASEQSKYSQSRYLG